MPDSTRRNFLANSALGAGLAAAPQPRAAAQGSPNDRINLAIVGIHGRGQTHIEQFGKIPGVRIAYLCDIDERLFPESVAAIEAKHGYKPKTHFDLRKVLEDPRAVKNIWRANVTQASLPTPRRQPTFIHGPPGSGFFRQSAILEEPAH